MVALRNKEQRLLALILLLIALLVAGVFAYRSLRTGPAVARRAVTAGWPGATVPLQEGP
jgi:hypothetical protein